MGTRASTVGLLLLSLVLPGAALGEILFSDTFDEKPDWSVPYTSFDQGCNKETGCTNKPPGYYGFYISRSVIPPNGHGLHLNSTNKRGPAGKGLTFWDQTNGTIQWTSGMQLGFDFPARKEVYVRYWVKMQPGYRYFKGDGGMMMRKLNHISHYVYNGKPFTFFNEGGHHPTTVNQVQFGNAGNLANVGLTFFIRPDTTYNGAQLAGRPSSLLGVPTSAGVRNYFDLPDDALPQGNYVGTGTEYNSPGMFADGGWHSLEFYLKTNTAPGVGDGLYKFWLDGILQIDAGGLVYRDASSTLPEDIWNFVHLGGNAYSPFLGLGVSGEQWFAMDDVVISTTYSGPPPKPVNVKASALSDSVVRVTWTAGTNNAVYPLDGYRVHYGTDPANLSQSVTVGKVAQADVTGLQGGKTYHFAVTGFHKTSADVNENESIRSVRTSASTPIPSPTVTPTITPTPTPTSTIVPTGGDSLAPKVAITSPAYGSKVRGVVTVTASASDNVGVSKVTFLVNGVVKATDVTAPFSFAWDTRTAPSGTNALRAIAYDAAGNSGSTSNVNVTVANDITPPTVTVTSPTATNLYSGTLAIRATATDNVGVAKMQIFVDGAHVLTTTGPSASASRAVALGTHTVIIKAFDAATNVTTVTRKVNRVR